MSLSRREFLKTAGLVTTGMLLGSEIKLFANTQEQETVDRPDFIEGVYVPYNLLTQNRRQQTQETIIATNANTVVIDIKNEAGRINVEHEHPLAVTIPPSYMEDPENVSSFIEWARTENIYVIGRQVVMVDPRFVQQNPRLGLRTQSSLWHDHLGNEWSNPFQADVWSYNTAVAVGAAEAGISQVMLDYVRFPSGDSDIHLLHHTQPNTPQNRVEAITGGISQIKQAVEPLGTQLSAAFFGYTAWESQGEMGIGQDIVTASEYLDELNFMLYPDLLGSGIPSCDDLCRPATEYPYEVLYEGVVSARSRINEQTRISPWIQAYPYLRSPKLQI